MDWWNVLGEGLDAGFPVVQQLAAQKLIDEGIIRRPLQTAQPLQVQSFSAPTVTHERNESGNAQTPLLVAVVVIVIALLFRR